MTIPRGLVILLKAWRISKAAVKIGPDTNLRRKHRHPRASGDFHLFNATLKAPPSRFTNIAVRRHTAFKSDLTVIDCMAQNPFVIIFPTKTIIRLV